MQVLHLQVHSPSEIKVTVKLEAAPCVMQLETGSLVSIILANTLWQLGPHKVPPLQTTSFLLCNFHKQVIALKGVGTFKVLFKSLQREVDLVITKGPYASLLGMNCFEPLGIAVTGINQTSATTPNFSKVCEEFSAVFNGTMGFYNGPPVPLQLDPTVWPILQNSCQVPFALKP